MSDTSELIRTLPPGMKEREYKLAEVRRLTGRSYASLHKILDALEISPRPSKKDARALVITKEELDLVLRYLAQEQEEAAQTMAISGGGSGMDSNRLLAQAVAIAMARDAQHEQFAKEQVAKSEIVLQVLKGLQSSLREQMAETATMATAEAVLQELKKLREEMATSEAVRRRELEEIREQMTNLTRSLTLVQERDAVLSGE